MSELKREGNSRYTRRCEECVQKTLSNVAPHEEMWAGSESLGVVQHYTNQGCSLTVSRGHYLVVHASFVKFPHKRLNPGVGFSPLEIY